MRGARLGSGVAGQRGSSSRVRKPCVTLPALQLAWSTACVVTAPSGPLIQKTQPAAADPVRPCSLTGASGKAGSAAGARWAGGSADDDEGRDRLIGADRPRVSGDVRPTGYHRSPR